MNGKEVGEMGRILVSGLVNMETTVPVRQFPVSYYPIDYPFFGVNSAPSGVAFNIAKALATLEDQVDLCSITGRDFPAEYIRRELEQLGISTAAVTEGLSQTAASVVLYDPEGRRQVYCDLKDIQEASYSFDRAMVEAADLVAACNINFNRPLLHLAKAMGKPVATDVHVLGNADDDYNREFLECADIVFLSDEAIGQDYQGFVWQLVQRYNPQILVLGRGCHGAALYLRGEDRIEEFPAFQVGPVVNTVGAGDALFSSFLHYYTAGKSPREALCRAQLFAARKISVAGAAQGFPGPEEMENLWAQYR